MGKRVTAALTDLAVKAEQPSDRRREIPDGKISGLYLIIQPTGQKSWAVRYRAAGKPRKFTLGDYPTLGLAAARKRAQEALGDMAKGVDPGEAKQASRAAAKAAKHVTRDLVEKVVDDFIERYARPNTRDWEETARLLKKDVAPAWRGRRLSEITRADVHALLDAIVDRGAPIGANRTLAQLRKMTKWALSRGIIDRNPCDGVEKPSAEKERDRVLSDDELAAIWRAGKSLGFPYGPLVQLLVLTGQRLGEVAGMRWSEIDFSGRVWSLPAERVKNGRAHALPLSPQAIVVISDLPRFENSDFTLGDGAPPNSFSHAKRRLDGMLAVHDLTAWTFHDLRRSVASGMARIGVELHVIERCLNHVSGSFGGIVAVYQKHKYETETRAALEAWGRHIDAILSGKPAGNVVELAAARA